MAKATMMTTTATSGRPLCGQERRLSEESWLARPRLTGGEYCPRLGAAAMHRNRAAPHDRTKRTAARNVAIKRKRVGGSAELN